MGVLNKFMDAIRLSDDEDYDDDDIFDDDEMLDEEYDKPKKKRRSLFGRKSDEELDEELAELEESISKSSGSKKTIGSDTPSFREVSPVKSHARPSSSKVTPIRKRSSLPMTEVCILKPMSMEDTREIADTLMASSTVVLNLEGIDVDLAQRIIDFSSGSCYALGGKLQKISSYIFILTPENVEVSGDFTELLNGAFDLSPIRTKF